MTDKRIPQTCEHYTLIKRLYLITRSINGDKYEEQITNTSIENHNDNYRSINKQH